MAQYRIRYDPETRGIAELTDARLFETGHASPQPFLWNLGAVDWHLVGTRVVICRRGLCR